VRRERRLPRAELDRLLGRVHREPACEDVERLVLVVMDVQRRHVLVRCPRLDDRQRVLRNVDAHPRHREPAIHRDLLSPKLHFGAYDNLRTGALSRDDLTFISYSVLALIGRSGASPHDLVRMVESGGRVYRAAAASQYYAEPKRLERLGYLSSAKEPGRTRDRTVYRLTDAGLAALRAWGKEPASFPRIAGDLTVKLIGADLIGEAEARASILALRDELDLVRDELTAAEERAAAIPHRTKYLLLSHRLARRVVEAYDEWLDDVEHELES